MCGSEHSEMEHQENRYHFSENCVNKYHSFYQKKTCFLAHDSKFNNKFYKILTLMINSIFDIKFEIPEKKYLSGSSMVFLQFKGNKFIFNPNGLDTIIFLTSFGQCANCCEVLNCYFN